ncbi:MAG: serine hydrolase domain-containing protein [Stellaceae bacterium]
MGPRATKDHRLVKAAAFTACVAMLVSGASLAASAQGLPKTSPEEVGFSSDRLDRLGDAFQRDIDAGDIPGVVVVVARNGEVAYEKAFGYQNREDRAPMGTDAIFRIASMSKPITSVAVMMLAEEGRIDVTAPVSQYLPEFKEMTVGVARQPAQRPMTVQDLLRHTSGLAYEFFLADPALKQAYHDADVYDFDQTLAEMVTKLSKVPLAHQPGTTFEYSMSTDVLGRIVEIASGMTFDRFIDERIAQPLQMTDTGFFVSEAQAKKMAQPQADPATGAKPSLIVPGDLTKKPKWFSGGGGMVSTADDYARFAQMLLNGGELDDVRLLSPKTVALMTADALPPGTVYDVSFLPPTLLDLLPTPVAGNGFGLGFAVRKEAGVNPMPGSAGDFWWTGAHGTYFWVDPKEKLVATLMVQNSFDPKGLAENDHLRHEMRYLVYQAMIGPAEGGDYTGSSAK